MNHAVLVTGFGTYNGKEYYLVKNRCDTKTYQQANKLRKKNNKSSKQPPNMLDFSFFSFSLSFLLSSLFQLEQGLGCRRLHYDVQKLIQPVWNSN